MRCISITNVNEKTIALITQKSPQLRGTRAKLPESFGVHLHVQQRLMEKRLRSAAKYVQLHPLYDNFYNINAAFTADDFIQTYSW